MKYIIKNKKNDLYIRYIGSIHLVRDFNECTKFKTRERAEKILKKRKEENWIILEWRDENGI